MQSDSSSYRFSSPFIVRLTGAGLVLVGALVLVLAVLVALLSLPAGLLGLGVLTLILLLGGIVVLRRADVVRLGESGYRVRFVRGAGVRQAVWKDVEDVVATTIAGEKCVVLRLRDGRSTTVPVGILAGVPDEFVRDLQQHLNRGHGYRPLPKPGG